MSVGFVQSSLSTTSGTRANNPHVETIKYLIKDFLYIELKSILHVKYLMLSNYHCSDIARVIQ